MISGFWHLRGMRIWFRILFLSLLLTFGAEAATKTVVTLMLDSETAKAGDTVLAGVNIKLATSWHTYWRYGGDSGQATKIEWTLPPGVTAGEIQWPIPEKALEGDLITYVYNDEVTLLVPLKLAADHPAGPLELKAKVSWLECEKECVPRRANVAATLNVGPATTPSAAAPTLATWVKRLAQPGTAIKATAAWEKNLNEKERSVLIEWDTKETAVDFFPFEQADFDVQNATEILKGDGSKVRLRKIVKKSDAGWPKKLIGILVANAGRPGATAFEVKLPLGESAGAVPAKSSTGAAGPLDTAARTPLTVPVVLVFAFLGGLILNIMPCVLPVIALKILGFVNQSQQSPREVRKLGLIYGAGVLASFLILALLVIGVQQAGQKASWGMQFGNPKFLVILTTLVLLVALNLFGVFEVTPGGAVMGAAGGLAAKEGAGGAFFNGVLATVLATPCTAPFLGSALGFAFTQTATVILLVFLVAGAGLAAPYVVLSFQPGWLKFLPKPGAWMEKFKIAMGFPMLATAVWLFTVTSAHFGKQILWLGIFLVVVALVAWIYGEFVQRGRGRKGLALVIALILLGAGYGYALEKELNWRSPQKQVAGTTILKEGPDGIEWYPWSPQAVAKGRQEGRPVIVDFTADWCVTCQVNKKTSIEVASVRAKLKEINALALLADYTLVPDDMTVEIQKYGRAGVPLVLVYPAKNGAPPIVLPDGLLTPGIVLDALDKAAR